MKNQCDGCERGMGTVDGVHHHPDGTAYMACTKDKYEEPPEDHEAELEAKAIKEESNIASIRDELAKVEVIKHRLFFQIQSLNKTIVDIIIKRNDLIETGMIKFDMDYEEFSVNYGKWEAEQDA